MKFAFSPKLTFLIISSIFISNFAIYTALSSDSIKEISDYLTEAIDTGIAAQLLKERLKLAQEENQNQLSKEIKHTKPKRFYRWPNAATRTRVRLLNNLPSQDLDDHYRRKELEKNMIEKNRMYQYFHG